MSGKALVAVLAACGLVLAVVVYRAEFTSNRPPVPKTAKVIAAPTGSPSPSPSPSDSPSPTPLPASVRIQVPYTPQAPRDDWPTHEDYCEAAALLMYAQFLNGDHRSTIPAAEAQQKMAPMVTWERQTLDNPHPDLTLDQIGQEANHFFGFSHQVMPATLDAIRAQLAAGHPVIIPVMTHGAPGGAAISPHYSPGNVYHVVLLVGYTAQGGLIANDAGFMEGQNWIYSWRILLSAIRAQEPKLNQGQVMLTMTRS